MSRSQKSEVRSPKQNRSRPIVLRGRRALSSEFWILNSGFSLTEVMFAVIVLGIGFIMVAAMFPVSISQSRLTVEETSAAAIARNAMADTTRLAENGDSPPPSAPNTWGPLLPATDFYRRPPTEISTQTATLAIAPFTLQPNQSITIPGKVVSLLDARIDDGLQSPVKYRSNMWNTFKASLIVPSDGRYAWAVLYKRDVTYFNDTQSAITASNSTMSSLTAIPAPFAQVYFIPVAVRNRTLYDTTPTAAGTNVDLETTNTTLQTLVQSPPNLVPRILPVQVVRNANAYGGYVLNFVKRSLDQTQWPFNTAVEGAYVVISDDRLKQPNTGRLNGHIYRLGSRRADLDTASNNEQRMAWELAPGSEFQ